MLNDIINLIIEREKEREKLKQQIDLIDESLEALIKLFETGKTLLKINKTEKERKLMIEIEQNRGPGKPAKNEDEARKYFENLRWSNNIVCVHCGSVKIYKLNPKINSRKSVRKGVYKCGYCKKQFTVTVGTIFEGSHISLMKWLIAINLFCNANKFNKVINAHKLHKILGITYKSAWFITHKIKNFLCI